MASAIIDNIFEFDGGFYVIEQMKFEAREKFMERVWYILNRFSNLDESFDESVKLSIFWSNVRYLNCKYNDDIMEKIKI